MPQLLLGLLLFLGVHSVAIAAPHWRDRVAARLGPSTWRALYSLLSLAGFLLLIHGFGLARGSSALWYSSPAWMHDATRVLMLPVFSLLLAAYFPGRIQSAARHPMLVAVKLWAFAHLLSNGRAADVLLFGAFLGWAVIDRISLKRRSPRAIPAAPRSKWNDTVVIVAGLGLYALFVGWAHLRLFGVPALG